MIFLSDMETIGDIKGYWTGDMDIPLDPVFAEGKYKDLHLEAGPVSLAAISTSRVVDNGTDLELYQKLVARTAAMPEERKPLP